MEKQANIFETKIAKQLAQNSEHFGVYLDRQDKDTKDFNLLAKDVLTTCYDYYLALEQGKATQDKLNKVYETLRNLLHSIGKVNGYFVSAKTKTVKEDGTSSTLLYDCMAFCRKTKKTVYDEKLASLINERNTNSSAMTKALNDREYTLYETCRGKAKILTKQIRDLQSQKGKAQMTYTMNTETSFSKLLQHKLGLVITCQASETREQIEADRLALKKAREQVRKDKETEFLKSLTEQELATCKDAKHPTKKELKAIKQARANALENAK